MSKEFVIKEDVVTNLSDDEYLDLLRSYKSENIVHNVNKGNFKIINAGQLFYFSGYYNGIENKISKILVLRISKAQHKYSDGNGKTLSFKAQSWKNTADPTIKKRTVDPIDEGNPYHYWEFKTDNNIYMIHYMYKRGVSVGIADNKTNFLSSACLK